MLILTYVGWGLGSCMGLLLLMSNVLGVVQYVRSKGDSPEGASAMSMVAWALSFFGLCLGPCGLFTAAIAFIIARIEVGKVYREEASPYSLIPTQMASINALMGVLMLGLMMIASVIPMVFSE